MVLYSNESSAQNNAKSLGHSVKHMLFHKRVQPSKCNESRNEFLCSSNLSEHLYYHLGLLSLGGIKVFPNVPVIVESYGANNIST